MKKWHKGAIGAVAIVGTATGTVNVGSVQRLCEPELRSFVHPDTGAVETYKHQADINSCLEKLRLARVPPPHIFRNENTGQQLRGDGGKGLIWQ